MSLSKIAQRTLRHTCYCHPRKNASNPKDGFIPHFNVDEGRMIRNGTLFICHECDRARRARFGRRLADKRQSPIENKIERALTAAKSRFIREFKLGQFEFDFAIPSLKVLVEIDSRSYHQGSDTEDVNEGKVPPAPGTKRHAALAAGWKLVRVRNGPRLVQRFFAKVTQAVAVVNA
jgi:very-short-patch-repair endonuclease